MIDLRVGFPDMTVGCNNCNYDCIVIIVQLLLPSRPFQNHLVGCKAFRFSFHLVVAALINKSRASKSLNTHLRSICAQLVC